MKVYEILKSDYDLCYKELKKATKKIEKQEKEIERLNNRIDKAIEYISEYRDGWSNWFEFTIDDKLKLLDILKGGNENEMVESTKK